MSDPFLTAGTSAEGVDSWGTSDPSGSHSLAQPTRADRPSRSELRMQAQAAQKQVRRQRALWKAWWLYPLLAVIGSCVYFGVRSASTPVPDGPQWVVTSSTPSPSQTAGGTLTGP